ncbi:hypothetical protein ACSU64_04940 [Bacillaceae bacterium C204]|uniref:hypothetical protein n=1 Tax=Neobacillus sp. 204 TaxID=3383351 RepID=UPI00397A24C5
MDKDIMKCFIGKVIKVDRGGPESKIGMVMDASDDLLVLLTEDDGVVYYNTKHIKSFTDNTKDHMEFNIKVPKDFKFIKASNFQDLLDSLKFKWIKINRGGPEKLEGVLTEVNKDYVFLINNQEIVRLSMNHIKSISYGLKIERVKEKSDTQQSHHKVEKSNDDRQNKKNKTETSKKRTSQKTTVENAEMTLAYPLSTKETSQATVVDEVEMALAYPLSTEETLQETVVNDAESDRSILLSTMGTWQDTAVEASESDLSIPLSTMGTWEDKVVEDTESDRSIALSTMGTWQDTAVEDNEIDRAIALSIMGTSQYITVEDAEIAQDIPLSTKETSQKTALENIENDLADLFSTLEKFLRKYSK